MLTDRVYILDVENIVRRHVSVANGYVCCLRTTEGAKVSTVLGTKVILICSLVASLGKYAFRIQNPSLFIDCKIENSIVVVSPG